MPAMQNEQPGAPSPQEALGECHRCIVAMLDRLEAFAAEYGTAAGKGPPGDTPDRARKLIAEIDEALGVHMLDEESDIFPALLAAADSPARRAQAFELVSSLLVEHRELAELWHTLRIALLALGNGVGVRLPGGTAADFLLLARRHIAREDLELAELMGVIGPARSREIGIAMAHRHDEACPLNKKGTDPFS